MNKLSRTAAGFLMIGVLSACATALSMAPGGPGTTRQTGLGEVFTDAKGMTLYIYDADAPGKSNCTGICAVVWLPVIAAEAAEPTGGFTTITRDDGTNQWAYQEMPLYGYINDAEPGDTNGDGVDGEWHAAEPL